MPGPGPRRLAIAVAAIAVAVLIVILASLVQRTSPSASIPPPATIGSAAIASPTVATSPAAPLPTATARTTPPSRTPIPLPTFVQLSAPSADVVWALVAGEVLFRSSDRGGTWQEIPIPAEAATGEVSFISEREGWVAAYTEVAVDCAARTMRLWHTTDGWASYEGGGEPRGIDARQCKGSLSFVDPRRGFVGAWLRGTSPVIYRTLDGGRTWSASSPLPDPPEFRAQDPSALLTLGSVRAFGSTLLVDASANTIGSSKLHAYRSTDGGATWSFASTAPAPFSLAFVTASWWIQLSATQDSRETTDGGTSWHRFVTDYQQAAPLAPEVVFADANVGYATVRGSIQRMVDGGAHWTAIRTPGT